MSELLSNNLKWLAIQAQMKNIETGLTTEEFLDQLLEGINKLPDQLQAMVDSIVSMQKEFPMPKEGWEAFVRDIEHTNEKHGINLMIKPELLENEDSDYSELE